MDAETERVIQHDFDKLQGEIAWKMKCSSNDEKVVEEGSNMNVVIIAVIILSILILSKIVFIVKIQIIAPHRKRGKDEESLKLMEDQKKTEFKNIRNETYSTDASEIRKLLDDDE